MTGRETTPEWDGSLTEEQLRLHAEVMRNDAALFAAIARTERDEDDDA